MKISRLVAMTALATSLVGFAQAQTDGGTAPETPIETPTAETPAPATETPATETPATETPPADAPATEAPSDQPSAETDSAAAPAPAEPEVVTTQHGDWELRCTVDKTDCFMYQLLQDSAQNPVAEFTLLVLPQGSKARAGVTVVTPLGTLLEPGLVLQIDSSQARKYGFTWCDRSGCFARFGLESAQVDNYKRGNVAKMRILSASNPQQPVDLAVSLSGFTAAYNEMEAVLKAATEAAQPAPASE
ncbi:invasion associated locus B family protein [Halovulum sp. GXIMD14793]